MANPEHLAVALKGAAAIAEWRVTHPESAVGGLDLSGADLSWADLTRANLSWADLSWANLTRAILSRANLTRANLTRAILSRVDLTFADLSGANLLQAILSLANLLLANLLLANLSGANLSGANLLLANLSGANLSGANLFGANLAKAMCYYTVFGDCDLGGAVGLDEAAHVGLSTIGVDTIIRTTRSLGGRLSPEARGFFVSAGVPEVALDGIVKSVQEIKHYSCFISYGSPDKAFAEKLRNDLEAKIGRGQVWMYEMDKTIGKVTWEEIDQMLDRYEKVIFTCSLDSLTRDGVKRELKMVVEKAPEKLMPVSLDNDWRRDIESIKFEGVELKPHLTRRNYANFAGWEKDEDVYNKGLADLLKGLERGEAK